MKQYFILLVFFISSMSSFKPIAPKRIIFFGDSITQAGVGPKGYISLMKEMLEKQGKASDYELIGAGIGGNKVYDLYLRLEEDVLSKKPDIVYIFVGVNDVWHKISYGTGTDLDKYEKFYRAIIKKLQAAGIKVICCTPAVVGERKDYSNQLDGDLNLYSKSIRKIAADQACGIVDLRQAFLDYILKNNQENAEKGILTTDKVHLNDRGNLFVAEKMLEELL
jgi:isoamyl acetate esterase